MKYFNLTGRYFLLFFSPFLFLDCGDKVENTSVFIYNDTSTFVTTTTTKTEKDVEIQGDEYAISEYVVFPRVSELRPIYRIPSVAITTKGTVLVSCENREKPGDKGEIDILVSRKKKNNDVLEIKRVYEYDNNKGRSMNPVFLVDEKSERIYLFVCHLKDTCKYARDHSTDEVDFVYKYSEDDGNSWSEEYSLKEKWDTTKYTAVIPSSVKGITTSNGIMFLPTMVVKNKEWYSGLLINRTGEWYFSSSTPSLGDNECTVYEDNYHNVVLDCRTYENTRRRYIYNIETDNFIEIPPSELDCKVAISAEIVNDNGLFYMCYPDSPRNNRDDITFYGSKDGVIWSKIYRLMKGYADYGYSSIALRNDQMYTCYETTEAVYLQDISSILKVIKDTVKKMP